MIVVLCDFLQGEDLFVAIHLLELDSSIGLCPIEEEMKGESGRRKRGYKTKINIYIERAIKLGL